MYLFAVDGSISWKLSTFYSILKLERRSASRRRLKTSLTAFCYEQQLSKICYCQKSTNIPTTETKFVFCLTSEKRSSTSRNLSSSALFANPILIIQFSLVLMSLSNSPLSIDDITSATDRAIFFVVSA